MKRIWIIISSVTGMVLIAGALISYLDWTPKEVELEEAKASFEQELMSMAEAKASFEEELLRMQVTETQQPSDGEVNSMELSETIETEKESMPNESDPVVEAEVTIGDDSPDQTKGEGITESIVITEVPEDTEEAVTTTMEQGTIKDETVTGNKVDDTWVQSQIDAHHEEINDEDLVDGMVIYDKLDTDYLFGLAEDGLTEEEKNDVNAYLDSVLSQDEKTVALTLYNKYIHLME